MELGDISNYTVSLNKANRKLIFRKRKSEIEKLDISMIKLHDIYKKIDTPTTIFNRHIKNYR